jgi:hypothetical protein
VGPRAGLNPVEKSLLTLLGMQSQLLRRPVCSSLLYRLSHPGSYKNQYLTKYFLFLPVRCIHWALEFESESLRSQLQEVLLDL